MLRNKLLVVVLSSLLISHHLFAQSTDIRTLLSKGMFEYNLGNYDDALRYAKQAYLLDKKSKESCYQMALTYLALNKNEEAVMFSGKLMDEENEYRKDAYLLSASAWDNLGREYKARKMYEEGLKIYPNSYLLHYNFALNLQQSKDYDEAMQHAIKAIEIQPDHSSSHLLLAYIMYDKGERIQCMLPLYYFLLIEPGTDRSISAYNFLDRLWKQGVRVKGQKDIRLLKSGYNYNDFSKMELLLSEVDVDKPVGDPLVTFADNNRYLFSILSDAVEGKEGFLWEFYVKYFARIYKGDLTDAFSYFISNCKYEKEVKMWADDHGEDIQRLMDWVELL